MKLDFIKIESIENHKHFEITDKYKNHFEISAFSIGEVINIINTTFKKGEFVIVEVSTKTGEVLGYFEFNNTPF